MTYLPLVPLVPFGAHGDECFDQVQSFAISFVSLQVVSLSQTFINCSCQVLVGLPPSLSLPLSLSLPHSLSLSLSLSLPLSPYLSTCAVWSRDK